jgi:hypothetical protein
MNGHGGMARRTSRLTARVLRRWVNENVKHAPSAMRIPLSFRPRKAEKPAASLLLVDNKGKTSRAVRDDPICYGSYLLLCARKKRRRVLSSGIQLIS